MEVRTAPLGLALQDVCGGLWFALAAIRWAAGSCPASAEDRP